ncbi:MAG TPA: NnrS family protein [Bryobacteraceae bacterium]|nr:NnrS family protein [Bryobacteraceae bacterium]
MPLRPSTPLPAAWREALQREERGEKPLLADPLPERRLARLLAAFILAGLVFLVLPGTLLGVWNLLSISARHSVEAASAVWIQSHGQAQLFGWVGAFFLGISLYAVPKFRGGVIRSLALGWAMFGLWTGAVAARWFSALWDWHWRTIWPLAAAAELAAALLLVWQCTASSKSRRRLELWNQLVFAGFGGMLVVLALQLAFVWPPPASPLIPEARDRMLVGLALWIFCFPIVWGFSTRFLPAFLGLEPPGARAARVGMAALVLGASGMLAGFERLASGLLAMAVLAACWSLRIFHPAPRPAKLIGVDPRYPWFVRAAFAWLIVSALLPLAGVSRGLTGASRHAFTVGFLATLIFSLGPRILPSFLNSRELWSLRLMLWAMALLTAGCTLRVTAEPLAYSGSAPFAWRLLPVSACIELTAVLLFAWNLGRTLFSPMPAWIEAQSVHENLPLYWYVTSYPGTRRLLVEAGLQTLGQMRRVPRFLTLKEAAEADGVSWEPLVALLRDYFDRRLARALKVKRI